VFYKCGSRIEISFMKYYCYQILIYMSCTMGERNYLDMRVLKVHLDNLFCDQKRRKVRFSRNLFTVNPVAGDSGGGAKTHLKVCLALKKAKRAFGYRA
jgi:hypothetical protein